MRSTWEFVPSAVLAALGVLALLTGSSPGRVTEAAPESISASPASFVSGGNTTITVIFDRDDPSASENVEIAVSVTPPLSGSPTLSLVDCFIDNGSGFNTACAGPPADGDGAANVFYWSAAAVTSLDGNATTNRFRIRLNLTASCDSITYTVTASQQNASGVIQEQSTTVNCTSSGTPTPTVTGTPATATPTVTGTPGAAAQITVSAAPTSIGCQGSAFITAVVKTATGANVPDGTQVQLSTTIGTITPATATTVGGGILAVLTAPANQSGSATVRAQVGTVTGETVVQITCVQATNTPVPPAATLPPTGIQPPATGDAGLAAEHVRTYLGVALLAVSALGGLAAVRKRSEA